MLNVSEVLNILEKEGLTSSRQVLDKWSCVGFVKETCQLYKNPEKQATKLPKQTSLTLSPRKKNQLQAPKPLNRQAMTIKQATRQP